MSPREVRRSPHLAHGQNLVSLGDWEIAAAPLLRLTSPGGAGALGYIASGAADEETLHRNVSHWRRKLLVPRVLAGDVSCASTSTKMLGFPVAAPIGVAPTAYHRLVHGEAELATARGASAAGMPYCVSSFASESLEAVAAASAGGLLLMQLYAMSDRAATQQLVERAAATGAYKAIVLTVDRPVLGRRDVVAHSGFDVPWAMHGDPNGLASGASGGGHSAFHADVSQALSWEDVAWLRGLSRLPVVLKGILAPSDASRAVLAGAAAVWVSNHGGRQLDSTLAALDALPAVAAAVRTAEAAAGLPLRSVGVWVDGGARRGTDVAKALALGADFVWVGRPPVWGLAVDGERGVSAVLRALADELRTAMQLLGVTAVADIGPQHVVDEAHAAMQLRARAELGDDTQIGSCGGAHGGALRVAGWGNMVLALAVAASLFAAGYSVGLRSNRKFILEK